MKVEAAEVAAAESRFSLQLATCGSAQQRGLTWHRALAWPGLGLSAAQGHVGGEGGALLLLGTAQ